MRPIQLKIAGLHSFREMQEVDFAALCQGGVFGIFGPTGSGKSTILDAMTLALYGKVERASNNTTGIMNQAEDRVFVSYTFELRNASGVQRYQVERAYKRSDEFRLRSTMARLIAITDGDRVLADKDREVTAKIEEILGLKADDFTRAVVLPQGKFAEFLMLQGSERRKMLQRLFQLEKYGDRLLARLKQRKEQADVAIKEIVAEQTGLGDCSSERVQEVHRRLQEALAKSKHWRAHRETMERKVQEKFEIWQKQLERQHVEQRLNELQKEEESYVQKEQQIERAKQAERIYPYLEQWRRDEEQVRFWQERLHKTGQAFAEQQALYEQQLRNYEQARLHRLEEEPKLLIRIESLKQAQEIKKQLEQLEHQSRVQQAEFDHLQQQREVLIKDLQVVQQKLERARQLQQELQEEVDRKAISTEDRERVTRALHVKHQHDVLKQEMDELCKEWSEKQRQLKSLEQAKQSYHQQLKNMEAQIAYEVDNLALLQQQLMELQQWIGQIEVQAEEQFKRIRNERLEEERLAIAHQLAVQLQEGMPCPVCGSIEHPNPAHLEVPHLQANKELEVFEQRLTDLRDFKQRVERLLYQIGLLGKSIEALPKPTIVQSEIAYSDDSTDGIESFITSTSMEQLDLVKTRLIGYEQRFEQLQQAFDRLHEERHDLEKRGQELMIHLSHTQRLVEEYEAKLQQKKEKLEELFNLWQEQFGDLTIDSVEALSLSYDQRSREVEQLQKRLQNGSQYIQDHERQWQQKDLHLRELTIALTKLETEMKGIRKSRHEVEDKIYAITQGQDLDTILQKSVITLNRLQHEEEQLRLKTIESEQGLRQMETDYKAAEQSLRTSQERHEQSRTAWEMHLQQSTFADKDEVIQARLTQEQIDQLQEAISSYREQRKIYEVKLAALIDDLNGQEITEEQWHSLQQQLEQAKREDELALQEQARAERDYEDIVEKHKRWQQLEQRRVDVSAELERLQQLQSVLRGNAFVDFIAEEQLMQISRDASERLSQVTRGRYAIEVDSNGGFVIADHANGGVKRPVSTLSGGETFLTSLSLALSLSAQVQLRGQYPLEFFFLDEGFGTLDQELLETVITTLERLHSEYLSIGLISHVPELKERIMRKIVVEPAEMGGRGSKIVLQNV